MTACFPTNIFNMIHKYLFLQKPTKKTQDNDNTNIADYEAENVRQLAGLKAPFTYILFKYLDNKELTSLRATCKTIYKWSHPEINQRKLDQAFVRGNDTLAYSMLMDNPSLLSAKIAKLTTYSGKVLQNITPIEAAILEDDIDMLEMMREEIDGGEELIATTIKEIFPDGIEAHRKAQKDNAFNFSEIMLAIVAAPIAHVESALAKEFDNEIPLHNTLDNFRKLFAEISHNERAFNIYHFITSLQQYEEFFDRTDNPYRRDLMWRQVVGWTQRFFPACWAQATAQGVYYILEAREELNRSFKHRDEDGNIFPLVDHAGNGFDFATDVLEGCTFSDVRTLLADNERPFPFERYDFSSSRMLALDYLSDKNKRFDKLTSEPNQAEKWCLFC